MNDDFSRYERVWIGLAEVIQRPRAGVLLDRNLAYVNILAVAHGEDEYGREVTRALDALGFDLLSMADAEPLPSRMENGGLSAPLLALVEQVLLTGSPQFGTFHTWTGEE